MSIAMDASDTDSNLFKCDVTFFYFSMICQKNKCLSNSSIKKANLMSPMSVKPVPNG